MSDDTAADALDRSASIWSAVEKIIDRSTPTGLLHHGLGALAASRLGATDRPIPTLIAQEARSATLFPILAATILDRVRQACDEPLLLMKGPEIARLYPRGGRGFSDIDLLTPNPHAVQQALLAAGFRIDEESRDAPQHVKPLVWSALPLKIELHGTPKWPDDRVPPRIEEIFEASVPSGLGLADIQAPSPADHALILAVHSWCHRPLRIVRDLIDVAVVSPGEAEMRRHASSRGVGKLWDTTQAALDSVLYGAPPTVPLRTWARHLARVRDATVFEAHLEHILSPFWDLSGRAALLDSRRVLKRELGLAPGDTWRRKLTRSALAVRHGRWSAGAHDDTLRT